MFKSRMIMGKLWNHVNALCETTQGPNGHVFNIIVPIIGEALGMF